MKERQTKLFVKGQILAAKMLEELNLPNNAYLNNKIDTLKESFDSNNSIIIYGEPSSFKSTIYKAWKNIEQKNQHKQINEQMINS